MKVIFLDIDGTITTLRTKYSYFDEECVGRINDVIKNTDAYIVISSSFRLNKNLDQLKEFCKKGVVCESSSSCYNPKTILPIDRIVGATPQIIVKTKSGQIVNSVKRGDEISMWVKENGTNISKYIVIDDDGCFVKSHAHRLVKVDSSIGFSESDSLLAVQMLK